MMGGGPRGPFNEGIAKYAPILLIVLFAIVGAAAVIDFIQDRRHPQTNVERFDPAKNFSNINSRGMVNLMMSRSAKPQRDTQEKIQEKTYEAEPLVQIQK